MIGPGAGPLSPATRRAMRRVGPARQLGLALAVVAALAALLPLLIGRSDGDATPGLAKPGGARIALGTDTTPFPDPGSKKGLQVQLTDDALALGVRHATLNVQLAHLAATEPADDDVVREVDGETFRYSRAALEALDAQVQPLSRQGIVVYFILLARATGDVRDELILHPDYDASAPNRLSAFDTTRARRRAFLQATVDLLAGRYRPGSEHGLVWGWIVGNEVNSHWWWANRGAAKLWQVASEYEQAVRLVHDTVTRHVANARVYVSLEHHWGIRYPAGTSEQCVPGRDLLTQFARRAREGGDFPWHVAFHPYPEDLFDCRTWEDTTTTPREDTPRITFENLEVLTRFLEREELRHDGLPRRVILSEQGFHCRDDGDGERDQAAALAYAWVRTNALDTVDALIYHRHVDHAHEGGLRLGLWTREPESVATPRSRRLAWTVWRDCDGPRADAALEFALPIVGVER